MLSTRTVLQFKIKFSKKIQEPSLLAQWFRRGTVVFKCYVVYSANKMIANK